MPPSPYENVSTSFNQTAPTDDDGWYHVAAIPAGVYEITASASGFKAPVVEALTVEVGRALTHDFRLEVGDATEVVVVEAGRPLIDRTATVGHVVTEEIIQEVPLNGRDRRPTRRPAFRRRRLAASAHSPSIRPVTARRPSLSSSTA
jgi:hypothetical protein